VEGFRLGAIRTNERRFGSDALISCADDLTGSSGCDRANATTA
jgi:hypothetical protein